MSALASAELAGQVAVVTGSSSGIGRAIALELAAAGADVLVHGGRDQTAADAVADELHLAGRQSQALVVDLSQSAAIDPFFEEAWKWRGGVDIWVNNAGANTLMGDVVTWDFEQKLTALWRVDVEATVRLSRLAGRRMKQRRRGMIVNIGWDQAETGMAGDSGELFATTKGAVTAFTRSLAKSLAPEVRVNCVAPGWVKTAWGEQASSQWQERAARESLLGRWGTPEDVARAVRFLASPAAEFITGQVICVNGGRP